MFKELKRKWLICIVIVSVLVVVAVALCMLRFRNSVSVRSTQDIMTGVEVVQFRQDDARWAEEQMGNSVYRLGPSGCLVTCIASALDMTRGLDETPASLNEKFSQGNVYDAEGNLQWDALRKLADYQVDVCQEVSAEVLDDYLKEGRYPIVRVRMNGVGNFHYVLVVQAVGGEYQCMDPLEDKLTSLSDYGNRIYAIRCVY